MRWEASRGDRKLATWAQFLDACCEQGTGIYITSHGRLYDMANGRDWRNLVEDGVDSGYESGEDVDPDPARRRREGAGRGTVPHRLRLRRGYDPRTRQLIEQRPSTEPAKPGDIGGLTKAGVVRHIVRSIAQGVLVSSVRRDLNHRGIPAPEGGEPAALLSSVTTQPPGNPSISIPNAAKAPSHRNLERRSTSESPYGRT